MTVDVCHDKANSLLTFNIMLLKPWSHKLVQFQIFLILRLLTGYIIRQLKDKQIKQCKTYYSRKTYWQKFFRTTFCRNISTLPFLMEKKNVCLRSSPQHLCLSQKICCKYYTITGYPNCILSHYVHWITKHGNRRIFKVSAPWRYGKWMYSSGY